MIKQIVAAIKQAKKDKEKRKAINASVRRPGW